MEELIVIVPSRGRPEQAVSLADVFDSTCTTNTSLCFAVDCDDDRRCEYERSLEGYNRVRVATYGSSTMVAALNFAARVLIDSPTPPFALGFMGDDHRPRTRGWDEAYVEALRELGTGIVYGNDLLQGERLPTQAAMTVNIVKALGHMAPPCLRHLYVDNYWIELGRGAECLRYLAGVIVEHMHPAAGKSEWTEGHKRVNDHSVNAADLAAYRNYVATQLKTDIRVVRALR